MASIRREILIETDAAAVWDALRDVGALHTRVAKGFVTHCEFDGDARTVTFANGLVARELILSVDDPERRIAWSVVGGSLSHHNASLQVFAEAPDQSRAVWICDLRPDALAPTVAGMIGHGLRAMKGTLEAARAGA